jgi:predicted TIM-barrel fold metal-dependent hydrolase
VPERWTTDFATRLQAQIQQRAPTGAVELAQLEQMVANNTMAVAPPPGPNAQYAQLASELRAGVLQMLGPDATGQLDRYTDVLGMVTRPRHEIAAEVVLAYPSIELFTPLLVDYEYFAPGTSGTPLTEQLKVHSKLTELSMRGLIGRADARLHPFAPFNPLREVTEVVSAGDYQPLGARVVPGFKYACNIPPPDTLREHQGALNPLRHAIERLGFLGVKVYPPVGFLPLGNDVAGIHADGPLGGQLDQALRALYAYCEAEQVPLTTHTANSNGYHLGYGMLAEPAGWAEVLQEFPGLRLNLGHFGHVFGVDDERGLAACEAWMRQAAALMQSYPNVYADVSNSPLPSREGYSEGYLKLLAEAFESYPRIRKRLMYGSDWWMNKLDANHGQFLDAFSQAFGGAFEHLKADLLGNNALRFLGFLDEDGLKDTANRNRSRLLAFYGVLPRPRWL